ncbi:KpsF/GutQ family sugar-phosphate isomerase [Agarilytica rhodophyticola]|uniref:KpsF/GutQ family sugar-phosphate isomerase n=1 Tax=Agarilytica rhodophyticola TaxID=1737490 RepID=UPI000B3448D1|nr:KpsF/GutQ family sugar-phosphate isomerase [Agarilytica rhodophyticola]
MSQFDYLSSAKRTVSLERDALTDLLTKINGDFVKACELILSCQGRVIVVGIGKSGHIAKKIAATLASTGTPAFFVHPSEASHGDLGMITKDDITLMISNSGASAEIVTLLPMLKRLDITLISMTGKPNSPVAEAAHVNLDISVQSEACPLNLAPTSSTTVTLALGDALAVALLEARGFTAEDFAFSHPGGALGKKLLLRVQDVMHGDTEIPKVTASTPLKEALSEMTTKGFGMTIVVSQSQQLMGIFTDGDLRRAIEAGLNINSLETGEVMTKNPKTINQNMLAAEALGIMQTRKITALVVKNNEQEVIGVLHMHDLLRAGII